MGEQLSLDHNAQQLETAPDDNDIRMGQLLSMDISNNQLEQMVRDTGEQFSLDTDAVARSADLATGCLAYESW